MFGQNHLATCLLLSTLIGCASPPADPPIRLLDSDPEVTLEAPGLGQPNSTQGLKVSRIGKLPRRYRPVQVIMSLGDQGEDSRPALVAPPGTLYRFDLVVPREALLEVGLGYVLQEGAPSTDLEFKITISSAAEESSIVLQEARSTHERGDWQDRTVDLSAWAGQSVQLELAVTAEPSVPAPANPVVAAWATPEIFTPSRQRTGPNVILISLDTLRADHLGCYGYPRPTSPNLDALAKKSYLFRYAISQAPWTRPSHRSMMTGLYPVADHSAKAKPIAHLLWDMGFRTGAITGGGQVHPSMGFDRGFETYKVHYWVQDLPIVFDWLEQRKDKQSFLFLHTFETHEPYSDPRFAADMNHGRIGKYFSKSLYDRLKNYPFTEDEKQYVEALYDGGIAYLDEQLGLLFEGLEQRGVLDNTILIITSDHGEQFWEHGGWRHGQNVYDHQIHVPLIVYLPANLRKQFLQNGLNPGEVINHQVSLVDLFPTILDLVGGTHEGLLRGRTLLPLLRGEKEVPRLAFSENTTSKIMERQSLRTRNFKFVYSFPRLPDSGVAESFELYDLARDPGESENLAAQRPELVARFMAQMQSHRTKGAKADETVPEGIDEKLRKQLEALGYLGDP